MTQTLVFTDIDGTLIDFKTYSFAEARPAVSDLLARNIPLILCSSKTRAEQIALRDELKIKDPFIVENGSAIFVPEGYFSFPLPQQRRLAGWQVIELGVNVSFIRHVLRIARNWHGLYFQGYNDLSVDQIAKVTGLDIDSAERALEREYSETIVTPLTKDEVSTMRSFLERYRLAIISGGKLYTVMSAKSNKGMAVELLISLYRRKFGEVISIGLGDSANDGPLLAAVDYPYLVQKPGGTWQEVPEIDVRRVPAVGPQGWTRIIPNEIEAIEIIRRAPRARF